jgi:hypothetical protein
MRTSLLLTVTSALAVSLACANEPATPTELRPGESPLAAKPPSNPTVTDYISNDADYLLRGDGGYLEGVSSPFAGTSRYLPGECGVTSNFFALPGGSGDATLGTGAKGRCTRTIRLTYARINADGSTTSEGSIVSSSFLNVRKLQKAATSTSPGEYIPVGGDAQRTFAFSDDGIKCGTGGTGAISFDPVLFDGTATGSDFVNVHRDASDTWTVTTTPDEIDAVTGQTIHHDKAYCKGNGKLYHIPLRFSIRSSVTLSP